MKNFLAAGLAAVCAVSVSAESSLGAELNKTSYEDSLLEAQSNTLSITYQHRLHEYVSVIGKYGLSIHEDNVDRLGDNIDFTIESMASAYAKIDAMPREAFNVYGMVGYARAEFKLENFSETESDMSYGFGIEYNISEDTRVVFEGVKLMDKDSIDFTTLNLGLQFNL